jgi:hypothetical protein
MVMTIYEETVGTEVGMELIQAGREEYAITAESNHILITKSTKVACWKVQEPPKSIDYLIIDGNLKTLWIENKSMWILFGSRIG